MGMGNSAAKRAAIFTLMMMGASGAALANWAEAALTTRWTVVDSRDAISDAPERFAYVKTTRINGRMSSRDYARVLLICTAGKPSMMIDWTFRAAGKANLTVQYRFAGQPGRRLGAVYVNRSSQKVEAMADIRQFLADARVADEVHVRVTSDTYGLHDAVFAAKGGAEMSRRFTEACPSAGG